MSHEEMMAVMGYVPYPILNKNPIKNFINRIKMKLAFRRNRR